MDMNSTSKPPRQPLHRSSLFWITILIVVVLIGLYRHTNLFTSHETSKRNTIPVVVATAKTQNVPVYIRAIGTVTADQQITVKPSVSGILVRQVYHDGQYVKTGDLLAEVDPRPFQAQLEQYEGQLIRDQALLENAKIDLNRYKKLLKQDSIAAQTVATQSALVRQYEGNIITDQGLIAGAKVNLDFCKIRSPATGRIGLALVDPGNLVQPSDANGIGFITTLDPIDVIFILPEDDIAALQQQLEVQKTFKIDVFDRDQIKQLATGTLAALDNAIDVTTGTLKLKALLPNPNNALFPNQFVNVRLLLKTLNNALTVPTAAIQFGNKGPFVYQLNADQTVKMQPVKTGITTGDITVIASGINRGVRVITEGADNLTDGATVKLANGTS